MSELNWGDRCFVATIFLLNSSNEVLLSWDKDLQTWLPIGGHMLPGENPEDAIKRKVAEEIGIEFDFLSPHKNEKVGNVRLSRQHRVQIEDVVNHKEHINFVFVGKCKNFCREIKNNADEQEKFKWFSEKELLARQSEFLPAVHSMALESIYKTKSFRN